MTECVWKKEYSSCSIHKFVEGLLAVILRMASYGDGPCSRTEGRSEKEKKTHINIYLTWNVMEKHSCAFLCKKKVFFFFFRKFHSPFCVLCALRRKKKGNWIFFDAILAQLLSHSTLVKFSTYVIRKNSPRPKPFLPTPSHCHPSFPPIKRKMKYTV